MAFPGFNVYRASRSDPTPRNWARTTAGNVATGGKHPVLDTCAIDVILPLSIAVDGLGS